MDVNHRYFVDYATRHGGKVLDYGCGSGETVKALRDNGVDCYGTDVFYEAADRNADDLIERGIVRRFEAGEPIPFPDDTFDLIISNQVLEHVADLELVARELSRVLKPDGTMLHHFPSLEVLREGHIGIPLVHRLPKGRLRTAYTVALRSLGFGYHKQEPPREWARRKLDYLDRYCFYRPVPKIEAAFQSFTLRGREARYCRFRARRRLPFPRLQTVVLRRLAFMALEMSRKPSPVTESVARRPSQ